jgi:hypothetical protein
MLNYEVDPSLLKRYIPLGTTLDSFRGKTYVSLVGFRFCRTKLLGYFPVPFHTDFEEVNLRFYVRRSDGSEDRRGVVFIAEVVPRRAIAITARLVYGENYRYSPMKHRIEAEACGRTTEYQWEFDSQWCKLSAQTAGPPAILLTGVSNNSSLNTTGVIRVREREAASNTICRTARGSCGLLPRLDLKGRQKPFMGANWERFSNGPLTPHS